MLKIFTCLVVLPVFTWVRTVRSKDISSLSAENAAIVSLFATGKSSKAPIRDSPITASDRGFYINRPTVALPCPISAHCDFPTNVTAVTVNHNTTASLASAGAKNQIFVNGTDGALTYNPTYGTNITTVQFSPSTVIAEDPGRSSNHTTGNSSDIAAGFATSPETVAGPGRFHFGGVADGTKYTGYNQFWACPNGEENPVDVYRVFVGDDRLSVSCYGIELLTRNFTGMEPAAWGY